MAISLEDVRHVAYLARLGLSPEEEQQMVEQLGRILAAMQVLRQVDTEHIPPTASVLPLRNVMRDDVVRPSWPREAVLKNAPRRSGDCFEVPAVLESSEGEL
jgi:aspartyl-tRNA(Asn)/glutamyl-tRNA(Gln) amidotransferase subunit C